MLPLERRDDAAVDPPSRSGEQSVSYLNNPEHWRARAKAARDLAEYMIDPASKQDMLKVASQYEELAKRAENRAGGEKPPSE